MYSLGNPVKFSDPSGNYPDDVLQTHFGCDDWSCVEAQFQDGGQHAGRWGWLKILMTAEDGDAITSSYVDSVGNRQTFSGHFATTDGRIVIQPSVSVASSTNGINIIHYDPGADPVGAATGAVLGALGVTGGYHLNGVNGIVSTAYSERHVDCRHTDCVARAIDTAGVIGAGITVGSPLCGPGVAVCAGTGRALSAGSAFIGTGYAIYQAAQGDLSQTDASMFSLTTATGVASRNPRVQLIASLAQLIYDTAK